MTLVLDAKAGFERAQGDAKSAIDEARAYYGLCIKTARDRDGSMQGAIAERLGLTREQVRRYQRFYEDWTAANKREPNPPAGGAPDA